MAYHALRSFDNLADLYAIIKTTEALEKAFLRDAVSGEEYKAKVRLSALVDGGRR